MQGYAWRWVSREARADGTAQSKDVKALEAALALAVKAADDAAKALP